MRALTEDDLVVAKTSGDGAAGVPIATNLEQTPLRRLRVVGGEVVDGASITSWYIDDMGRKRATAGDGRQPLVCAFDAALVRDAGVWRVRTDVDDLVAYANKLQWRKATGGLLADLGGGVTLGVPTDTTGLALVNGAVSRVNADSPPATIQWQTGPTTFVTLTAAQIRVLGNAVADHVQATFDDLADVLDGIGDGTITSTREIDEAFA